MRAADELIILKRSGLLRAAFVAAFPPRWHTHKEAIHSTRARSHPSIIPPQYSLLTQHPEGAERRGKPPGLDTVSPSKRMNFPCVKIKKHMRYKAQSQESRKY